MSSAILATRAVATHRDGVAEAAAVRADPPDRSAVGIDLYAPGSTG